MRSVVVCRSMPLSMNPGAPWCELSPLVDRPFLHHLIETVVGHGIRELDIIVPERASNIANALGSGTRWGARFRYYTVADAVSLYDGFRQIPGQSDGDSVLLVHSEVLPRVCLEPGESGATLFFWEESEIHWTGWGVVRLSDLQNMQDGLDEAGLLASLTSKENAARQIVERPLMARSYPELLESNRRVLSKDFPGLVVSGKEVQPGVWIARNVKVHPTASLAAPAFLGENCRIGALAHVGPGVSIGKDCMIERETQVTDSVVYAGSYVGQQLALKNVVVDRSRLINTACEAEIEDVDDLLLGSVFGMSLKARVRRVCSRVAAFVAILLLSPCFVLLLAAAAVGLIPKLQRTTVVQTPTVLEPYRWKTFELWSFGKNSIPSGRKGWVRHLFFSFLPALAPIAVGYMGLAGPRPRPDEEIRNLPAYRRWACLRMRSGILQPPSPGSVESDDDVKYYEAAGTGFRKSLAEAARYAGRVLRCCLPSVDLISRRSAG